MRGGSEAETAFRLIDDELRPRLLRYFRAHGFPESDSEDLVQNTLARVYRSVQTLEDEEKFMPWLFTIARNVRKTAAERRRQMSAELPDGENMEARASACDDVTDQIDPVLVEQVWASVSDLPAQQRQCLVLRIRDDLSYEEVARILNLSVHTVRNHIAQAKKSLRRILTTHSEGDI